MRWHRDAKLLYLAHPKTASVATTRALDRLGCENPEGLHHHARICELSEHVDLADWTVITAVRDHRDALVSWWHVQDDGYERPSPEWLAWLAKESGARRYFRPGRLWWMHTEEATRVLRYENLESELNAVLTGCGLPEVTLPQVNVNLERAGRHWREFLDEGALEAIEREYGEEMRRFGYVTVPDVG